MFTHQAHGCLVFFREEACSYMDACVRTWVLGFVHWWSFSYRCGCFCSWVLIFVRAWSFLYVWGCFQMDAGEWGRGHGCIVVIEDHGGGGGGGGGVVIVDTSWLGSLWTHGLWWSWPAVGVVVGVVVVVVVVVATVVVVGRVLVLIHRCCCWWAMVVVVSHVMERWGQNSPMMVTTHAVVTI